jgi:hypothetical protein
MRKTISLNSFIVAKINGTIAKYPNLEEKKFYVLTDLIILTCAKHCQSRLKIKLILPICSKFNADFMVQACDLDQCRKEKEPCQGRALFIKPVVSAYLL